MARGKPCSSARSSGFGLGEAAGSLARLANPSRFIPTHAYVPPGVLRASITYPHSADASNDAVIAKALADVGLERLEPLLGKSDRWDRLLSDDEKQRLAFARVILQRPRWVVIDNALDLVDPASRRRIEAIFTGPLVDVGVINIGNDENDSGFFTRTLHLVTGSERADLQAG